MYRKVLLAALSGCMFMGAAQADITFSFGSDGNADGPTFAGGGLSMFDGGAFSGDGQVNVDFLVDTNGDGAGGGFNFAEVFLFGAELSNYTMSAEGGGFVHIWHVQGAFSMDDGTFDFGVSWDDALLVSYSESSRFLGTTMTLQGSEGIDPSVLFQAGENLNGIGITDASISGNESFAFSLTNVRTLEGQRVPVSNEGVILDEWISEGSFSASAVPAPGALGLLISAGLISRRRRRNS